MLNIDEGSDVKYDANYEIMVRSNFNKTYYFPCLSALFYKVQFKVDHSD